jgi:methyl-accepting chemotaxis protein
MLFKLCGIVFVSLLVTAVIFYFYSDVQVGTSYRLFHVKAKNFLDFLLPVVLVGFFVSLVVGVGVALFFPHDFAGPLYRIEKELIDIGRGNLRKEIRLRKDSEVHNLADAVNAMVMGLRNNVTSITRFSEKIGNVFETASAESADETLNKIESANADLQEAVNKFKL